MTFNPESSNPDHWVDVIHTWAQVENVPEEVLGYVCFSNFLASIQEDLSVDSSWSLGLQEKYLEASCDGNDALMNVVRWAASSRDYLEGLYACGVSEWAVFEARDLGMYQVAIGILGSNFKKLDVAEELAEEIRKKLPSKPAAKSTVN